VQFVDLFAIVFLVVGAVICTFLTLAPLTRRQRRERKTQEHKTQETPDQTLAAEFDPLDAASNRFTDDIPLPAKKDIP